MPNNMDIPIAPYVAGPTTTCNFELYSKLSKDISDWVNLSHRLSMAYWTLRYNNDVSGSNTVYNIKQFRYLFNCLPPLIKQAIPLALEHKMAAANAKQIFPGNRRGAISQLTLAKKALTQLNKWHSNLNDVGTSSRTTIHPSMRPNILNANHSVAEALLLADAAPENLDGLGVRLLENLGLHMAFGNKSLPFIGLNPWQVTSV